jgi:hypothetical protein
MSEIGLPAIRFAIEEASFREQGPARTATDSASGNAVGRGGTVNRRASSSLRKTSRLRRPSHERAVADSPLDSPLDCASVLKHSPDDSSQCRKPRTPVGGKKNVSVSYSRRDLR